MTPSFGAGDGSSSITGTAVGGGMDGAWAGVIGGGGEETARQAVRVSMPNKINNRFIITSLSSRANVQKKAAQYIQP
jgi:hypothetical protein